MKWMLRRIRDEHGMEYTYLERLLIPMEQQLLDISRYVEALSKPGLDEDDLAYDSIIDDSCDAIEDLLGAAFVVSQTHITQVVSRTMSFLKAAAKTGKAIPSVAPSKESILGTCSKLVARSPFTEVQTIDSFANYFKHHEEWSTDWRKLTGLSRKTADVITAAGAEQGSTGNFRAGAKALGNGQYTNLGVVNSIIAAWRNDLADLVEREAKTSGLIK